MAHRGGRLRRRSRGEGRPSGFWLPGAGPVVPGVEHWEFPLVDGRFAPEQSAWLVANRIGIRAIDARPGRGSPWWDELLPEESDLPVG